MTAMRQHAGRAKTIQFDSSKGPCVIPPGTWDMADVTWVFTKQSSNAQPRSVRVAEGAVLTNLRKISGAV
jgi:hypothetical protein